MSEEDKSLKVEYGLKTLTDEAIKRLIDVEKAGISELTRIDKKWAYGSTDNFANSETPMSLNDFMIKSSKDEKQYVKMLRDCYRSYYLKSDYYKSALLDSYGLTLGNIDNWPKVPTLEDFYRLNTIKPYSTDGQTISDAGKVALENLYKQYLQDAWPQYWKCEIYDDLTETNRENPDYNKLCQYTVEEFSRDLINGPNGKEMTEDELKKMIEDIVKEGPSLDNLSLDSIADMIDQINEILGSNTLKLTLKTFIDQEKTVIVSRLLWSRLGPQLSPYDPITNPSGINYKNLTKDDFEQYKENLKGTIKSASTDIYKEVEEKIKELYKTASGVWDNIIAIPKTLSMMITAASIPQVIPTTGGIPNIARILLDVMNIIEQVLALIPPIIEGLANILTVLKALMIDPRDLPMVGSIIDMIERLKSACSNAKEKNAQNLQNAKNQIEKDKTKLETLKSKYEHTNDDEKKAELKEQIDALTEQIASSEAGIKDYEDRVAKDEKGEYITDEQMNGNINLISTTIKDLSSIAETLSSIQNYDGAIEIKVPKSNTIVNLEMQQNTITPYCGKTFQIL